jgi:anaerobic selenocysteine-containing dehydrogenase
MTKTDFYECMNEAQRIFPSQHLGDFIKEVFWEEFSNVEKPIFMKAIAYIGANGARGITIDNITGGIQKARTKRDPEPRVKSDCSTCGGDGAVTVNNYAYSCNCIAGKNYPNFKKYDGTTNKTLKVEKLENGTKRSFANLECIVPNGMDNIKQLSSDYKNA